MAATMPRDTVTGLTAIHAEMQRWYAEVITFGIGQLYGRESVTFTMEPRAVRRRGAARLFADRNADEILRYIHVFGSRGTVDAITHMAYAITTRHRWITAEMSR